MRTVVYHPTLATAIADVLRDGDAPGTIVACSTEAEMAAAVTGADVLMATHCDVAAVVGPLTDDPVVTQGLYEMVDAYLGDGSS